MNRAKWRNSRVELVGFLPRGYVYVIFSKTFNDILFNFAHVAFRTRTKTSFICDLEYEIQKCILDYLIQNMFLDYEFQKHILGYNLKCL